MSTKDYRRVMTRARNLGASEDELTELRSEYNALAEPEEDEEDRVEDAPCSRCGSLAKSLGSTVAASFWFCQSCGWVDRRDRR